MHTVFYMHKSYWNRSFVSVIGNNCEIIPIIAKVAAVKMANL